MTMADFVYNTAPMGNAKNLIKHAPLATKVVGNNLWTEPRKYVNNEWLRWLLKIDLVPTFRAVPKMGMAAGQTMLSVT